MWKNILIEGTKLRVKLKEDFLEDLFFFIIGGSLVISNVIQFSIWSYHFHFVSHLSQIENINMYISNESIVNCWE